jgi:hypothetical protein
MKILSLPAAAAAAFAFYCACSNPQKAGSETTNGITVQVRMNKNVEVTTDKTMMVSVYSASFLPYNRNGFADSALVDTAGSYSFVVPDTGRYNLYGRDTASHQGALIQRIPVFDSTVGYTDSAAFDSLSTVFGTASDSIRPQRNAIVYAPGSPLFDSTDASGKYFIPFIPKGNIRFIAFKEIQVYWGPLVISDSATAQIPLVGKELDFTLK